MTDNIPSPDPSLATNERLQHAVDGLNSRRDQLRDEVRTWVDSLQVLMEEKIGGAEDKTQNLDRVVQTRLAGSETALNAAMAAADKVTQEIKLNIGAVLNELKAGMTKQIESLNEKIDDLKLRLSESGGWSKGSGQTITLVVAIIAAIAAVTAAAIVLSRATPSPSSSLQHTTSLVGPSDIRTLQSNNSAIVVMVL